MTLTDVSTTLAVDVSGQLSRDVIGCFKSNRWLSRDAIGCWFVKSCCYLLCRLIRTTESTGTLLNVFHSVQTTTNDLL